jgi:Bacterial regulatory proteins, gntR family
MTAGAPAAGAPVRAADVLADRMAAALVHREPGWRLPRRSALARRYNVSLTEIDVALGDLARRSLVRRLPDGQLYRASPADYWIPVEGAAGFGTRVDPMGGTIDCQTRHVSRREAPQDVAWALRVPSGELIRVIRCVWACAGEPAAVSTAYLHASADTTDADTTDDDTTDDTTDDTDDDDQDEAAGGGGEEEGEHAGFGSGRGAASFGSVLGGLSAAAVSVEMCPPQPSVARSLRLSPGQPVITVTVRFDDTVTGEPAGLTVVMLKPELFRITIETPEVPGRLSLLQLSVGMRLPSGHTRALPGTLEPKCRLRS